MSKENVADARSLRSCLMQKTTIPTKPRNNKTKIWQLVSSITIWYICDAMFLKVFQNVTERHAQTITWIWAKIVYNLRGSLDNIKGNPQQAELQRLKFHAIWDKGIFYKRFFDKVK